MNAHSTIRTLGVLVVLAFGIWWGGHPSDLPGFLRSAFVANPHDAVISEALSDIQHDYFHPVARAGRGAGRDGERRRARRGTARGASKTA